MPTPASKAIGALQQQNQGNFLVVGRQNLANLATWGTCIFEG